jgi:hypothetical protein
MMMNLSGPQPDSTTDEDIALITPMRNIQVHPLFEEIRLPTSNEGIRRRRARIIERPLSDEGGRDKPD